MSDELKPWDAKKLKYLALDTEPAQAAFLPEGTGDGYGFGGGAVVVIGEFAISIGERDGAHALAKELARRWNEQV